jgi:transposase
MDIVYRCCAGLDVHKKTVVVCVRRITETGKGEREVRTFGTFTDDLLALRKWLASRGVKQVAMESTGVYWKPIHNLLESDFEILLVNAAHIKQVPGRKTDVRDCEWIADLLQHGLLRGSFVPEPVQRELRDLTRHRVKLVEQRSAVINRIQKLLEDANIKLSSVVSDVVGMSSRDMLECLVRGETNVEVMAELARGRMRKKIHALRRALKGRVTEHHRYMLDLLLRELDSFNVFLNELNQQIEDKIRPFQEDLSRLDEIPGIHRTNAQNILAEIGPDMKRFPTDAHLASWAGVCPGNHRSAGKRKSGRTTKGNHWLRRALTQSAWVAARTKGTYLSAQYRRLAPRRGKKRAITAMANTILQSSWHLLTYKRHYKDLGADYFDKLDPDRTTRYLVKRLESLGHHVELTPAA